MAPPKTCYTMSKCFPATGPISGEGTPVSEPLLVGSRPRGLLPHMLTPQPRGGSSELRAALSLGLGGGWGGFLLMSAVGGDGACLCVVGLQGERVGLCRRGQTDRWPAHPAPTILSQHREGGPRPGWAREGMAGPRAAADGL